MTYPMVCIIIVNYNGGNVLKRCIDTIIKNTKYPRNRYKVLVIDNNSTDGSERIAKRVGGKNVIVIKLRKNYGFAIGTNVGILISKKLFNPKYYLLLNNDTFIIDPKWLKGLVFEAEKDKKIGLVGCKMLMTDKKTINGTYYDYKGDIIGFLERDYGQYNYIKKVFGIGGSCMLIKDFIINSVGLLDENFFYGPDDVDFSIRVRKRGFYNLYNGLVEIVHIGSFSQSKLRNDVVFKYLRRGRFILMFRHYPLSFQLKEIVDGFIRIFFTRRTVLGKVSMKNIMFHITFPRRFIYFLWALKEGILYHRKISFKESNKIVRKKLYTMI